MAQQSKIRISIASIATLLLLECATGCAKVRTETRRDIFGRPVTVTIKKGKDGKESRTMTRGDKPLPIEGYKFGGTASVTKAGTTGGVEPQARRVAAPSRSIFGGGGKWYVNGKPVPNPSQELPQAPIQGPQPEPEPATPPTPQPENQSK